VFEIINFKIFLFSALLFFIGYALAPTVYYKEINWLVKYPMWIVNWLDSFAKKNWKPVFLFGFLFALNTLSLMIDLLSAIVPVLPFIFAIWTGLNIGIVTYHTLEGHYYFTALFNPVAFFELPAAFITFAMAFQYNLSNLGITSISKVTWQDISFQRYLFLFLVIVLPILLMAGIIETYLIHISRDMGDGTDKDA